MSTNSSKFLTTLQAAKRLGVTDARVRQIILAKKLKATRIGNRLLVIDSSELERYARESVQ